MNRWLKRRCRSVLRDTFGIPDYRPGQRAAASCLLSGRDLLCILPTGAGKSLCWQLPAVVHEGLTIIVSPLIALMHDQVDSLRRRGIAAAAINSLMPQEERSAAEGSVRQGETRILLVSPERLETRAFLDICRDCPPWLVVVDEAHCIVQWGGDFRPAYSRIGDFLRTLPMRPVVCAMTATADEGMQRQIVSSLGMVFHKRVMLPVVRENLVYSVRTTTDTTRTILRLMQENPCRTVVFCSTRQRTERLAQSLSREGVRADCYHAGLDREQRVQAQERFRRGETQLLAATTAFGMGIDIPDIRRVIHDSPPESITALAQESGRAGRDGKRAECIVLFSPQEALWRGGMVRALHMATRWKPLTHAKLMRDSWKELRPLLRLLLTARCIPAGIAEAFGQRVRPCGCCSACLNGPLTKRAPDYKRMDEETLRLWLLSWQREALARRRGVPEKRLITGRQLREMARLQRMPDLEDAQARDAMGRLLHAMRRGGSAKK